MRSRLEWSQVRAACGDGDHHDEGPWIHVEVKRSLDSHRENDDGRGLVGHRLCKKYGQCEEDGQQQQRLARPGERDQLPGEVLGGTGVFHGGAEAEE